MFAMFPVVFLFSHNIHNLPFSEIWVPSIFMLTATSFLWLTLWGIFGNARKAGAAVSLGLIFFYSYGYCHELIMSAPVQRTIHIEPLSILVTWCILLVFVVISILREKRSFKNLTGILNVLSVCLVMMSSIQIAVYYLRPGPTLQADSRDLSHEVDGTSVPKSQKPRDIYYIVVDGYAGADVLSELYQCDNQEFLSYLKQRGFYVLSDARSNYCQTALSVASSLNCDYIDNLIKDGIENTNDRRPLTALIQDSFVKKCLKKRGFTSVAFSSGIGWTEIKDADVYLTPTLRLSIFQNLLVNMTPIQTISKNFLHRSQFDLHRERILFIFKKIQRLPSNISPKFVFAHIIAPHPPFVFNEFGEEIERDKSFSYDDGSHYKRTVSASTEEYIQKYRSQLKFVNTLLVSALDGILERYETPPIIILQSDHGPGSQLHWESRNLTNLKERFSILSAYYLPDDGSSCLYEGITPVNTFRVVLNHYFGMNFDFLKDESFFSTWGFPYKFMNVTTGIVESDSSK